MPSLLFLHYTIYSWLFYWHYLFLLYSSLLYYITVVSFPAIIVFLLFWFYSYSQTFLHLTTQFILHYLYFFLSLQLLPAFLYFGRSHPQYYTPTFLLQLYSATFYHYICCPSFRCLFPYFPQRYISCRYMLCPFPFTFSIAFYVAFLYCIVIWYSLHFTTVSSTIYRFTFSICL